MAFRFLLRPALLAALTVLAAAPAGAVGAPVLRGDVVAQRDALTLGDLVDNAPPALAATPLFRAPALGQTGTIQSARITAAAAGLGLDALDTGGRLQVTVTRAARRIGAAEVETVLKAALLAQAGLDPVSTSVTFDGAGPSLLLPAETTGALNLSDLAYDRRTRRVSATVWIGANATDRVAALRVGGSVAETVEVTILARGIERGQALGAADIAVERRPRDLVPADSLGDNRPVLGRVARRALSAGTLLRPADLARPELVTRGDIVTAIYEVPGVALAMRVTASEAGALGDVISVVNPASKKTLQATVIGSGRVSVGPAPPERVAANLPARF